MKFGKAIRNFTAVYTGNSEQEAQAVYEPSLHHLHSAWKLNQKATE